MVLFTNNDISFEVLSRFPAKSLLALKCISGQAKQLISDHTFIRASLKPDEPLSGFFYQGRFPFGSDDIRLLSYIPVDVESPKVHHTVFSFIHEDVIILGSCNGLVCLHSCIDSCNPVIYVCNPASKEYVAIVWPEPSKDDSLALAFDPFRNPAAKSTNFKVVRVRQVETQTNKYFSFDIYSSETGSWRSSDESCSCDHGFFKNEGIFIAGVLYWLTDGDTILMFDVENELSYLIRVPLQSAQLSYTTEICIGDSGGQLHHAIVSEYGLQVWVLIDYFSHQWDIFFSASLEELEEEYPGLFFRIRDPVIGENSLLQRWMHPLAFKDGFLFLRVMSAFLWYNIQTRQAKRLCSSDEVKSSCICPPAVIPFTLSLVPPK